MTFEPNLWGWVNCPQCEKSFMSDCGPDFCSSRCEREYSREHQQCDRCEEEFHEDDLTKKGKERYCGDCMDEIEEEERND